MNPKNVRIALRLTEDELFKANRVAELTDCNLSEAVRRMIIATRLEPVATINFDKQLRNEKALA